MSRPEVPTVTYAEARGEDDLANLLERLRHELPDTTFVVVLPADPALDAALIIERLAGIAAEYVFTDSGAGSGSDLAFWCLGHTGLGEDFVYTVPDLDDAIGHAREVLTSPARGGWEGEAILVLV